MKVSFPLRFTLNTGGFFIHAINSDGIKNVRFHEGELITRNTVSLDDDVTVDTVGGESSLSQSSFYVKRPI